MLAQKSGLVAQLLEKYSKLIAGHCAAHQLQLAVGDTLNDVTATNSFKSFLEKIYSLHSLSPKNMRVSRGSRFTRYSAHEDW